MKKKIPMISICLERNEKRKLENKKPSKKILDFVKSWSFEELKNIIKKMKILLFLLIPLNLYAKDIIVYEIDTGTDISHLEISRHIDKMDKMNHPQNYIDSIGHGTHIAGLILNHTCPEVKLISCKFMETKDDKDSDKKYIECINNAIVYKPDFINISAGGPDPKDDEYNAIKRFPKTTKIITAAGNDFHDLKQYGYYPASYELSNEIIVGALSNTWQKLYFSNYGLKDMVWELGENVLSTLPQGNFGRMSGTSQATALRTNKLLLEECLKIDSIPRGLK